MLPDGRREYRCQVHEYQLVPQGATRHDYQLVPGEHAQHGDQAAHPYQIVPDPEG